MTFRILREAEEEALEALTSGADTVFFVLQRSAGHWSPGTRIIRVFANRGVAELFAASQKAQHLQSFFAVAELISEARQVANPVEIVRLGTPPPADAHAENMKFYQGLPVKTPDHKIRMENE